VLFIDKPAPDAPSGLWSVDLEGNPPEFFTDQLGIYAPDMSKRAFLQNGTTFVEDLTSGERWSILNGGRAVSFSPDGTQLAWTAGQAGPPFDSARREVWVSYYDGTEAGNVYTTPGGGFSDWFPDGRLLVSSRLQAPESGQVYWALTPGNAEQPELLEVGRGGRLREPAMSADGSWLAYLVSFSDDPNLDGLWIANTHTGERRRLDVFGAYRWRDDQRLLVVPLDLSQPFHHLLQVEAASGSITALTDPQATPFKIAAGDWSVSPDGQRVVFVSAEDGNIWLLNLPPGP
jgi:Tol biopolymer transport system component